MIKAEIKYFPKSLVCSLKVTGHAGQAAMGQDIVCASASILVHTLAQIIMDASIRGELKRFPSINLYSGDAVVECKVKTEHYNDISRAYYFAEVGFKLLEANYPQYVELITDDKPSEA